MIGNLAYKLPADQPSGGGGGGINFSGGVAGDVMIRSGVATIGPIAGASNLIPISNGPSFLFNVGFIWDLGTGFHGVGAFAPSERLHVGLDLGSGNARFDGRVLKSKGADVAAAATLTVGGDGNLFTITGNTNIDFITTTTWIPGSELTLEFTGTPTLNHNTAAPPANTAPLFLSASTPFVCTVGCVLKFIYNGTVWKELSRTAF